MKRLFTLASLAILGLATFVHAEQGNPKLKTIEAIAFGPKGLLLIGGGPQIVSVETGKKSFTGSKGAFCNSAPIQKLPPVTSRL